MSTQVQNPGAGNITPPSGPFGQITVSRSAVAEGPILAALALLIEIMGFQTKQTADMAKANALAVQAQAQNQKEAADNQGSGQIAAGIATVLGGGLSLIAAFYPSTAENEHNDTLNTLQNEKTSLTTLQSNLNKPVVVDEDEIAEDQGVPHNLPEKIAQLKNGNFLIAGAKSTFTERTFDAADQFGEPIENEQVSIQATMEAIKQDDVNQGTDNHAQIMKVLDDKIKSLTMDLNTEAQNTTKFNGLRQSISSAVNTVGSSAGNAIQGGYTQAAGSNTMLATIQGGVSQNMSSIMNSDQSQVQKADQSIAQTIALVTAISNSAN